MTGKRALILPCLGRTELDAQASGAQFVSVENSMGVVHASRGKLEPASEHLKSEPAIVAELAHAVLGECGLNWRALPTITISFARASSAWCRALRITTSACERPKVFTCPTARANACWLTPNGKANFGVCQIEPLHLEDDELLMMTIRSHDQYNTTIYGMDDRYRGVYGERRVIFMNARDIEARGLAAGDKVDITSRFRGQTRVAPLFIVVKYDIPQGCAATYFPETNVLVSVDDVADKSNTPASKSVVIRVALHQKAE